MEYDDRLFEKKDFIEIPDRYLREVNSLLAFLRDKIRTEDQILPCVYMFLKNKKMVLFGLDFRDTASKQACANLVRKKSKEMDADFLVFASESYCIMEEKPEGKSVEEIRAQYPEDLSTDPRAKEILTMNLETPDGVWAGMGEIINKPKLIGEKTVQRDLGAVKWSLATGEGRLFNLLARDK